MKFCYFLLTKVRLQKLLFAWCSYEVMGTFYLAAILKMTAEPISCPTVTAVILKYVKIRARDMDYFKYYNQISVSINKWCLAQGQCGVRLCERGHASVCWVVSWCKCYKRSDIFHADLCTNPKHPLVPVFLVFGQFGAHCCTTIEVSLRFSLSTRSALL